MTARKKRPSLKSMGGSVAAAKANLEALKRGEEPEPDARHRLEEEPAPEEKPAPPDRSKATFDLPADLLREMRVLSFEVPPRAIGGSLSGLVELAVRGELEKLRAKFNEGKPFESDEPVGARRGRPPKV